MPISKPDYQLQLPLELAESDERLAVSGTSPFRDHASTAAPSLSADEVRLRSETARQLFDDKKFPWMEEYRKLREGGWDWRVAAYIAWASSPKGNRQPKSQDELAREHLGLTSDRAISTWRRKNPAIDEMVAVLQSAPLWEHRADVYEALIEMAKEKDYKSHNDRKLFLELIGDYLPAAKLEAILKGSAKGSDVDTEDEDVLAQIEAKASEMQRSAISDEHLAEGGASTAATPPLSEEKS